MAHLFVQFYNCYLDAALSFSYRMEDFHWWHVCLVHHNWVLSLNLHIKFSSHSLKLFINSVCHWKLVAFESYGCEESV